ncbi:MAG: CBS domain-containing protein, partial [Smithellaceae bacterium]
RLFRALRRLADGHPIQNRSGGGLMIVGMWMIRDVVTIEPHTLLVDAAALMARRHIRRLPVVEHREGDACPVGIVTATDILHAYPPEVNPFAAMSAGGPKMRMTADDIMSRALRTVAPETPIEDAARILRDGKISTLLVLQKTKLVGLITESDIFRAFVGILESTGAGARITFAVAEGEDIFKTVAPIALELGVRVVSLMTVDQPDRKLCVIRIAGENLDGFIDRIWKSGHTVLNVISYRK